MTNCSGPASFCELLQERLRAFVEAGQEGGGPDRQVVDRAVKTVYEELGLSPPVTIWCENPFQLFYAPLLLVLTAAADRAVLTQLRNVVLTHRRNALFEGLLRKFAEQTSKLEMIDKLPPLGGSLNQKISERLTRFEKQLEQLISPSEKNQCDLLLAWIASYLQRQFDVVSRLINLSLVDRLHHDLVDLLSALPIADQDTRLPDLKMEISRVWGASFTRFEITPIFSRNLLEPPPQLPELVSSLLAYQTAREFAAMPIDDVRPWLDLLCGGFAFQFFENFCFVCQYPVRIDLDDDARMHSGVGPAIEFEGLQKLYAWHGTFVPPHLIQRRYRITPWTIDRETNIELRRVMLEIYGMEKYLRTSRARIIHQDKYGTLYRKNFSRGEPLVVVAVTNATAEPDGTHRRYTLRVPPTMRTAREAVAWTFDVDADTYDPGVES